MTPGGLTCREIVELVTDYLEGALPAPVRTRFESHIRACPNCTNYVDQMRRTVSLLGRLRVDTVPLAIQEELLHTFRAWRAG